MRSEKTKRDVGMTHEPQPFLSFERMEMVAGERLGRTRFACRIHSFLNNKEINMDVTIELPHSDRKVSEIEKDIALAIHEAIDPTRLVSARS
jgi:hypothetical protein